MVVAELNLGSFGMRIRGKPKLKIWPKFKLQRLKSTVREEATESQRMAFAEAVDEALEGKEINDLRKQVEEMMDVMATWLGGKRPDLETMTWIYESNRGKHKSQRRTHFEAMRKGLDEVMTKLCNVIMESEGKAWAKTDEKSKKTRTGQGPRLQKIETSRKKKGAYTPEMAREIMLLRQLEQTLSRIEEAVAPDTDPNTWEEETQAKAEKVVKKAVDESKRMNKVPMDDVRNETVIWWVESARGMIETLKKELKGKNRRKRRDAFLAYVDGVHQLLKQKRVKAYLSKVLERKRSGPPGAIIVEENGVQKLLDDAETVAREVVRFYAAWMGKGAKFWFEKVERADGTEGCQALFENGDEGVAARKRMVGGP